MTVIVDAMDLIMLALLALCLLTFAVVFVADRVLAVLKKRRDKK